MRRAFLSMFLALFSTAAFAGAPVVTDPLSRENFTQMAYNSILGDMVTYDTVVVSDGQGGFVTEVQRTPRTTMAQLTQNTNIHAVLGSDSGGANAEQGSASGSSSDSDPTAQQAFAEFVANLAKALLPETLDGLIDLLRKVPAENAEGLRQPLVELCDLLLGSGMLDPDAVGLIGQIRTNIEGAANPVTTFIAALQLGKTLGSLDELYAELYGLLAGGDAAALLAGMDPEIFAALMERFTQEEAEKLLAALEKYYDSLSPDQAARLDEAVDFLNIYIAGLENGDDIVLDPNSDPYVLDLVQLELVQVAIQNFNRGYVEESGQPGPNYNWRDYTWRDYGWGDDTVMNKSFKEFIGGEQLSERTFYVYGANNLSGTVHGVLTPTGSTGNALGGFDSGTFSMNVNLSGSTQATQGTIVGYYSNMPTPPQFSASGGTGSIDAGSFFLSGFQGKDAASLPLNPVSTTLSGSGGVGVVNVNSGSDP